MNNVMLAQLMKDMQVRANERKASELTNEQTSNCRRNDAGLASDGVGRFAMMYVVLRKLSKVDIALVKQKSLFLFLLRLSFCCRFYLTSNPFVFLPFLPLRFSIFTIRTITNQITITVL
jgi:hypothetical protein